MYNSQLCIFFSRKLTITDSLEKCLKKGKGDEQAAAAMCVSLLCIQLGAGDETEEVLRSMRPMMATLIADNSAAVKARTAVSKISYIYNHFYPRHQ